MHKKPAQKQVQADKTRNGKPLVRKRRKTRLQPTKSSVAVRG